LFTLLAFIEDKHNTTNTVQFAGRTMRWAGHVDYGRQERCIQNFGTRALRVRDSLKGLGIDGRIILK